MSNTMAFFFRLISWNATRNSWHSSEWLPLKGSIAVGTFLGVSLIGTSRLSILTKAYSFDAAPPIADQVVLGRRFVEANIIMMIHHLSSSPPPKSQSEPPTVGGDDSSVRGLPPKSPSSLAGRLLSQSTPSVVAKPRSRRRSRQRSKGSESLERSSSEASSPGKSSTAVASSRQVSVDQQAPPPSQLSTSRSFRDPSPEHMKVAGNADDIVGTPDLTSVTFESSASIIDHPLGSIDTNAAVSAEVRSPQSNSWESSDGYEGATKSCLPFFRRQKVMSADVASVGNASDTLVMMGEFGARISGRELHEKAKAELNAERYDQAIIMFEALQKAQVDRFGEFHPSVGAATHNVAVVRLRMGQADVAEKLFERAVAIRRTVLGDDHLDLAASLAKLGSARVALQKFDDGLAVLREALQISQKTLGRSNKTVAQILCHIACLYFEASELFSAQATFEDALEIYRLLFPNAKDRDACMAQMTDTLCNIGSIQNKRKNFLSAIDCFREALDLQRGIMGHDHPRVIATLDNLGYSFSKAKMYNQAITCYKEMMTAQLSRHRGFSIDCCETLKKLIILYEKTKDVNGAIIAATDAMEHLLTQTPVPESAVIFEIEQILTDLKQKRSGTRRSGT